jgi:hypothetical protein
MLQAATASLRPCIAIVLRFIDFVVFLFVIVIVDVLSWGGRGTQRENR